MVTIFIYQERNNIPSLFLGTSHIIIKQIDSINYEYIYLSFDTWQNLSLKGISELDHDSSKRMPKMGIQREIEHNFLVRKFVGLVKK